jgi:hypothetical protein
MRHSDKARRSLSLSSSRRVPRRVTPGDWFGNSIPNFLPPALADMCAYGATIISFKWVGEKLRWLPSRDCTMAADNDVSTVIPPCPKLALPLKQSQRRQTSSFCTATP